MIRHPNSQTLIPGYASVATACLASLSLTSPSPWSVLVVSVSRRALTPAQGSRIEILNDGGFRSDGRKQYELRDISIDLSQQGTADGSATVTHGLTQVLVTVFGPREAKMRSQTLHDRAVLNVEISVAPFSTSERRKRSRADR